MTGRSTTPPATLFSSTSTCYCDDEALPFFNSLANTKSVHYQVDDSLYRKDASWPLALYQQTAHWLWQGAPKINNSSLFVNHFNDLPSWIAVNEFLEACHTLLLLCCALFLIWHFALWLCSARWPRFRKLTPARQWYVVNNLSKALNLAVMCLSASFLADVHDAYWLDNGFQTLTHGRAMWIKRVCALYVSSDIVSLFVVPKLPASTVQHHVVAGLLTLCIFATRFSEGNIAPMIALYGAWSSIAFPVNVFLALRCMYDESVWWMHYLAGFSCLLYAICCAFNWSMHAIWFARQLDAFGVFLLCTTIYGEAVLLYACAVCVWGRDDLILQSWLLAYMRLNPAALREFAKSQLSSCLQGIVELPPLLTSKKAR
jgi:hypothetical protein